jgi:hypothetical protein
MNVPTYLNNSEGGITLQYIMQVSDLNHSVKIRLRHELVVLLNFFRNMEFNEPLYYLTLPGLFLSTGGVYTGLNLMQAYSLGGIFDFGFSFFTVLLTFSGMCLAFAGILVHSIAGFMKYAENKL